MVGCILWPMQAVLSTVVSKIMDMEAGADLEK